MVDIVILAAGASNRFNGIKALAQFKGKSLLEHALTAAQQSSAEEVHVVLGAYQADIRSGVDLSNCNVLLNNDFTSGMASSIKFAVDRLNDKDALLLMTIDQPLLNSNHLDALIRVHTTFKNRMVAAKYARSVGIPAIFPKNYYNALMKLEGDQGAKKLLTTTTIHKIEMPEAEFDIDSPEELQALIELKTD